MDGDTMFRNLTPVVHPKNYDLLRVPLRKEGWNYTISVADGFTRTFNENTLPDVIKTKMAMILARGDKFKMDNHADRLSLYTNTVPELDEIGWRASETYFCLVLDRLTIDSLKGGGQNNA
jgi:hypothetical protein